MLHNRLLLVASVVGTLVVACDSGSPGPTPPPEDHAGAGSAPLAFADVEGRLRDAGLSFDRGGKVRQSFLRVGGSVLVAAGAEVQVYVYGNSAARARDTGQLDSVRVAPPTMMISWVMPASLATYRNVAAIVLSRDEASRQRIHQAITGGSRP